MPRTTNIYRTVRGYCVKCRKKRVMSNPKIVVLKRGRSKIKMQAWKGVCPTCGTVMYKIIGKA